MVEILNAVGHGSEQADGGVGESEEEDRGEDQFHGSASGDQGEDLAGCIVVALLGQLDGKGLKIADLLGGHGSGWVVGGGWDLSLPCLHGGPPCPLMAIGNYT